MSTHGDPIATEAALLRYAEMAQASGVDIVCDAFEEWADDDGAWCTESIGGSLTGVCVLAAQNLCAEPGDKLSLPGDGEEFSAAWDAIEHGFDGIPHEEAWVAADGEPRLAPIEWWEVGARLRERLKPRKART